MRFFDVSKWALVYSMKSSRAWSELHFNANEPRHDKSNKVTVLRSKTQADLSHRWAHTPFVGFVMPLLKYGMTSHLCCYSRWRIQLAWYPISNFRDICNGMQCMIVSRLSRFSLVFWLQTLNLLKNALMFIFIFLGPCYGIVCIWILTRY